MPISHCELVLVHTMQFGEESLQTGRQPTEVQFHLCIILNVPAQLFGHYYLKETQNTVLFYYFIVKVFIVCSLFQYVSKQHYICVTESEQYHRYNLLAKFATCIFLCIKTVNV